MTGIFTRSKFEHRQVQKEDKVKTKSDIFTSQGESSQKKPTLPIKSVAPCYRKP